jgi:hypothetical protein
MTALRKTSTIVAPTAVIDAGISRGRRVLCGQYASSRPGVAPHSATVLDDGTPIGCNCPAEMFHEKCWHTAPDSVQAIISTYWRDQWGDEPTAALQWRENELRHWLSLEPDEADANAARLEWGVIGDIIGERTA